ncbi:predicted protein [Naegleria gruberi]|uniref:Predicted protein n=1 Tax=Naegleria gruberi TaxID=5762 RepID=D2W3E3_NAEGR|nr:uncharacterized protein NAEGRDRAFT_75915 [Naegleria gruberi]EFC36374.1 predicted protein [Naegleria gruberi]|eukprot:XP_002669118.1 predicted protein [Naegleria gruberi strain NEG-M]
MTRSYIKTDTKVDSCKTSHRQDPFNFSSENSSSAFNLQSFDDKKKVNRKKEQNSYRNSMKNTMQSFERIEEIVAQGVDQCMSKKKSSKGLAPHHHRKAVDDDLGNMYHHVVTDSIRQKEPIMTHNLHLKRQLKENVDNELEQLKQALEEKQDQEFLDKYLDKRSKKAVNKLRKKMEREGEDFKKNIVEREEYLFRKENYITAEKRIEDTFNKLKVSYINSLTTEEKVALKELEKYKQTESPLVFKHYRKTKSK